MRRFHCIGVLLLLVVASLPGVAYSAGTISGQVRTLAAPQSPIAGAVVTVAAPDQPPTTVTTGSNGRFSIGVGGNGPYSLDVQSGVNTQNVKWERVVLHLSRAGTGARFSLSKPDVFGHNLFADLRIGPDGKLYQLATSPSTGVVISRYSLGRSS
jgi:Carboxypeptidase regulatory-like domain